MLCVEMVEYIFDFILPTQGTYESIVDIYTNANSMTNIIIDKHQWERYRQILYKVNRLHYFSTHYPVFVKTLKEYVDHPYERWRIDNYALYRTCLLDAVSSAIYLPLVKRTHASMSPTILRDIEDMLDLFPEMVHTTEGIMRCRYKVTPLYLAVINDRIPIALVEKLARQHKQFNVPMTIELNGHDIPILHDLDLCEISSSRKQQLRVYLE